jgi:hypothetical protein
MMQVVKTLGVLVCLFGAYLMYDGNILGENTAGLATVIGIIGIGIIGSSINSRSLEEERHFEGD